MKPEFMKLEDVKELQELVVDSVASVEPGLRLLESQATLGGSTIDLVALDHEEVLTLVALAFEADDEMMLRALEAYSWCLDSPDELRHQFPSANPAVPPRVIFIAERIPQAFLRKMKHLRFQRVDCLEFHFGLQFNHVGELRQAETPADSAARSRVGARAPLAEPAPSPVVVESPMAEPVAPPPMAPPPVAPAPAAPHGRHGRTDTGASKPAHRPRAEAPRREEAPPVPAVPIEESRGAAGGRAGVVSEDMVRTVREYLQREFPTAVIYDFYAHDRAMQMFHLQDSHGAVIHSASVSEEVLGDGGESQLRNLLEKHKLARVLRQAGSAAVAVTKAGLKIERR